MAISSHFETIELHAWSLTCPDLGRKKSTPKSCVVCVKLTAQESGGDRYLGRDLEGMRATEGADVVAVHVSIMP